MLKLDVKITEHLYANSYLSYLASLGGAILVFWLFESFAPAKTLFIWFAVFLVLTVLRFVLTTAFFKLEHGRNVEVWQIAFVVMSFISGTLWGLTGFIFIPSNMLSMLDTVIYHGMLLLFIAVLIAGSLITYSVSRLVYLSFSIPAVVPQCLMLIAKGDVYHSFLGAFMLTYAVVLFIISIYINRMLTRCCEIEAQNEVLHDVIKEAGLNIEKRLQR